MNISNGLSQTPDGFYTVTSEELYEGLINPEIMTTAQLDVAITSGIAFYKEMHPPSSWMERHMGLIIIASVAAVAVVAVGAVGASGASAAAGASTAAGTGTAAGTSTFGTITSAKAVAMAQKGAAVLASGKGKKLVTKVLGKNDADRLIKGADIIANSPDVTTAAKKIFNSELAAYGGRLESKAAEAALNERLRQEQERYAEYMRRQGYQLQEEITAGVVPPLIAEQRPRADLATVAMAATPFILYFIGQK